MGVTFEWDPAKDEANRRKHGIAFGEAIPAFMDPLSLTIPDPDHSTGEERFILLGQDQKGRLLVVSHTDRGDPNSNHKRMKGRSRRTKRL